jgi:hypothetical protein
LISFAIHSNKFTAPIKLHFLFANKDGLYRRNQ